MTYYLPLGVGQADYKDPASVRNAYYSNRTMVDEGEKKRGTGKGYKLIKNR
jgi:hypothetical protein